MRNYTITNFLCDQTYGGIYAMGDLDETNKHVLEYSLKTLSKHYGSNRPYIQEQAKEGEYLRKYLYIAWLDGELPLEDNDPRNFDESGDEVHGFHLFVIGFTDSPENCVDDIYAMGDESFDKLAKGFFY